MLLEQAFVTLGAKGVIQCPVDEWCNGLGKETVNLRGGFAYDAHLIGDLLPIRLYRVRMSDSLIRIFLIHI